MGPTANQLSFYKSIIIRFRSPKLRDYIMILAADTTINQSKSRTHNSDFYKL